MHAIAMLLYELSRITDSYTEYICASIPDVELARNAAPDKVREASSRTAGNLGGTLHILHTKVGEVEDGAKIRVGILLREVEIANDLGEEVVVPRDQRLIGCIKECVELLSRC